MKSPVDVSVFDQAFFQARTYNKFADKPVEDDTLRRIYDTLKWGPTTMNSQPGRYLFVRSAEAKAKLQPALSPGNLAKTMAAPLTAIVAYDTRFYDELPSQFPASPAARDMFANNAALAQSAAFRSGTLQGAYLILAARLHGLDAGPMSGFDNAKVDAAFFPDGRWKSNFLINLGYGDPSTLYPRGPRLSFDQVARIE